MGATIQGRDYVVIFNASWETLEDTLLFFHSEIEERLLASPGFPLGRAVGVHASSLWPDLTFVDYFCIRRDAISVERSATPLVPQVVHFLHFGLKEEMNAHRRLSARSAEHEIPMVNPHNTGSANCDSKIRMYEILKDAGIPTPVTGFISRFDRNKVASFRQIAGDVPNKGLYIQPDRGTEGHDCFFVEEKDNIGIARILDRWEEDFVVRAEVGNTLYQGRNLVIRLNVCFNGSEYSADSGFGMVGDKVVKPGSGFQKVSINRVLDSLELSAENIRNIRNTACRAVEAAFSGEKPALVVGVDLVLEKQVTYDPYVLDLNPRPVVVGSRILGEPRIGLGDIFWQGVRGL